MLEIIDLHVRVGDSVVLKGFSLVIERGQVHAIMGPNGAGKSTLARVLSGDSSYEVISGQVRFDGKDILSLDTDERARLGIFMGFQYPIEIPGVTNLQLLLAAYRARQRDRKEEAITQDAFMEIVRGHLRAMNMEETVLAREVNVGFSGGEKKRNEILQMLLLRPALSVLDETDSGLDIDAIRVVAEGINRFRSPENSLLLITHYQRLLDYIRPDYVHVAMDGKIVHSGGAEVALRLEEKGYDWVEEELKCSLS